MKNYLKQLLCTLLVGLFTIIISYSASAQVEVSTYTVLGYSVLPPEGNPENQEDWSDIQVTSGVQDAHKTYYFQLRGMDYKLVLGGITLSEGTFTDGVEAHSSDFYNYDFKTTSGDVVRLLTDRSSGQKGVIIKIADSGFIVLCIVEEVETFERSAIRDVLDKSI